MDSGFRRLFFGAALAGTANGIFTFAAGVITARTTGSTLAVGAITTAATLPWFVVSAPAGVLIDRIGPVASIVGGNLGRAGVLGAAAAAMAISRGHLWVTLLVAVFLVASLQTLVDAATEVATVDLVEQDELTRAYGWMSMATRLFYQFLAPAAGGVLVQLGTVVPGAVAASACLLAAIVTVPLPRACPDSAMNEKASSGKGIALVATRPLLASLVVVGAVTTVANGVYLTSFMVYAVSPAGLALSPSAYGLVTALTGAGAAVGALSTHRLERLVGRQPTLTMTRLGWAMVFAAPLVHEVWILAAMTFVGAAFGGMWAVESLTVRRLLVAREDLDRVAGAFRMLTYGMTPVGTLLGGVLGARIPPHQLFGGCALVSLLAIIPIQVLLTDAAIDNAATQAHP